MLLRQLVTLCAVVIGTFLAVIFIIPRMFGKQNLARPKEIADRHLHKIPDLTVKKECLESQGSAAPETLDFLRQNALACDFVNADLDGMPEHQLPLTYHSILDQVDIICKKKIRLGKLGDGGWEVCDDLDVRPAPPCIVYSFGINNDFSFDDEMARLYQCHVYSFDPSMSAKTHNRSEKVHFYNIGIYGKTGQTHPKFPNWQMYSLKDLRAMLGHENQQIDILKMDTEHSEWEALPDMIDSGQLQNVKQLFLEFHTAWSLRRNTVLPRLKLMQNIEKLGFKRFFVHKNWHCARRIPNYPVMRTKCYEVHYLMRK